MKLEKQLFKRSEDKCELCGSGQILKKYEVPPQSDANEDNCIIICDKCLCQIDNKHVERSAWRASRLLAVTQPFETGERDEYSL